MLDERTETSDRNHCIHLGPDERINHIHPSTATGPTLVTHSPEEVSHHHRCYLHFSASKKLDTMQDQTAKRLSALVHNKKALLSRVFDLG